MIAHTWRRTPSGSPRSRAAVNRTVSQPAAASWASRRRSRSRCSRPPWNCQPSSSTAVLDANVGQVDIPHTASQRDPKLPCERRHACSGDSGEDVEMPPDLQLARTTRGQQLEQLLQLGPVGDGNTGELGTDALHAGPPPTDRGDQLGPAALRRTQLPRVDEATLDRQHGQPIAPYDVGIVGVEVRPAVHDHAGVAPEPDCATGDHVHRVVDECRRHPVCCQAANVAKGTAVARVRESRPPADG